MRDHTMRQNDLNRYKTTKEEQWNDPLCDCLPL